MKISKCFDEKEIKGAFLVLVIMLCFVSSGFCSVQYEEYDYKFAALSFDSYQIILDVEDPCFELTGSGWTLAKTGSYIANYYWTVSGPGTGENRARCIAEGLPAGNYSVEFYVGNGNYPANAEYEVISQDGITTLSVNMNYVAAGWYSLGNYNIDKVCVINLSDKWEGAGLLMSVDALRFTLLDLIPAPPASEVKPKIGLCIDDCGQVDPNLSTTPIYSMLRLPFKMTFAVMPYTSYLEATADEVYNHSSEVILHQPMAAITVPNPGTGGITSTMTLDQVRTTVSANLDAMPHIVGMNNHMGSLISQQADKMQVCIEECKERKLYFYDSRTITTSVGYDVAKKNGLLTGERDLFIDGNSKDEAVALIRSLALRALYSPNTSLLAIGHVRSTTAAALVQVAPELQAMGVDIVPLSHSLSQVVETDFQPAGSSIEFLGNWLDDADICYSKELYDGYSKKLLDPSATLTDSFTFKPFLQFAGNYEIYAIWSAGNANASNINAQIKYSGGVKTIKLNQSADSNEWKYLGMYRCPEGEGAALSLDDSGSTNTGEIFRADAVRYVHKGSQSLSALYWFLY